MNRRDRRSEAARQRHAKAIVGMELRYGGRTLIVTAYVNTSETAEEVIKRVQPAARGPMAAMVIVTAGIPEAEKAAGLWAYREIQTLFGGRTVVVNVYVNTNEAPEPISARVMAAANTPTDPVVLAACQGHLAVITMISAAPEHQTRAMWKHLFKGVNAQKDGPN